MTRSLIRPLIVRASCITTKSYFMTVVIGLLISLVPLSANGQAKPQQPPTQGSARSSEPRQSTVRGRVIYEDTRRPLRRIQVTIYDPASQDRRHHFMAWTDRRGEFRIKNLPAGKYFVVVSAPGVVLSEPSSSEEGERELTSVTVDGSSTSEVVVRVQRGGAISGRVTYSDGDPAVNVAIRILRKKEDKWIPVEVASQFTDGIRTDERGIYRVSGLAPGEYVIGAAEEKVGLELGARDDPNVGSMWNRAVLPATYYAGTLSLSGATVLRIGSGAEEADIDITLAERPIHSISGVITVKREDRPAARARVILISRDKDSILQSDYEQPITSADEQGRFTFDEVPDGSYTLKVTPPRLMRPYYDLANASSAEVDASQKFSSKEMDVEVAGSDLTDLVILVSSGSRITGAVTIEDGKPLPARVFVYAEALVGGKQVEPLQPIRVNPDGTFKIEGLPNGDVYLSAIVPPDNQYYTKSVTVARRDLLRNPLHLEEGEEVSNVRIVISPNVAQITGRILGADGKTPQRGVSVMMVPGDLAEHGSRSSRIYGVTNADGSFRMAGAPGEYLVLVMRAGESGYLLISEALRRRVINAQRVVLQPGENRSLELTARNDP